MDKVDELAYVGVGARDPEAWQRYAAQVLGLEVAAGSDRQNLYLRMDERHHRLIVNPVDGGAEDITYLGWQVRDAAVMEALAARVEAAGVPVKEGSPQEAAARRVMGFAYFLDPHSGVRMELAYGPEVTFMPVYRPSRAITGFVTGNMGLGHFVTYVPDIGAAEAFYRQTLGFASSDVVGTPVVGKLAAFMYCNTRHHSLAFFKNPKPKCRTNHLMLEYASIDDVGTGLDICRARRDVKADLGRHSNDRMISFYTRNPSGWLLELGWGARQIDPETFAVEHYGPPGSGMGEWGHDGLSGIV